MGNEGTRLGLTHIDGMLERDWVPRNRGLLDGIGERRITLYPIGEFVSHGWR